MHLPLRRALAAPFRCPLSTAAAAAASRPPPWAMIRGIRIAPGAVRSPSPRASLLLAEPPRSSYLLVPDRLIDQQPGPDPGSDIVGFLSALVYATSGDGLLLVVYVDAQCPAPIVSKLVSGAMPTRLSELNGLDVNDPDFTRFLCNPLTGELLRLPDIDGTKKTMFCRNAGLLTRSAAGRHAQGPPDSYAVAVLLRDDRNGGGTFNMRRFLSRTGKWEKLVGLPSPLPLPRRRMDIYTEAVAFAGRLWWPDLTWGVISADPFSDRPELHFVELPRGSVWPVPSTDVVEVQTMHRRLGVSEGRLRYVEVSHKDPFVLSSFALDDDGSSWTLEHRVALGRLCEVKGGGGPKDTPRIGVIDPLNASVICVIVGKRVLAVDMDMGKVIGSSPVEESEGPAWVITSVVKPCVLPPWLASSKIPTTGTSSNKGDAKSKTLSDILVRVDMDKKN